MRIAKTMRTFSVLKETCDDIEAMQAEKGHASKCLRPVIKCKPLSNKRDRVEAIGKTRLFFVVLIRLYCGGH